MSGPGIGKILLENAKVFLISTKEIKIDADVYIHVKGYSLARVTHLDIENPELEKIVKPKSGFYASLKREKHGFKIKFDKPSRFDEKAIFGIVVKHEDLKNLVPANKTYRCWVGGKIGGIYIGFKKEIIEKLEKIAIPKLKLS